MKKRIFLATLVLSVVLITITALLTTAILGGYYIGELKKDVEKQGRELLIVYEKGGMDLLKALGRTTNRITVVDIYGEVLFDNYADSETIGNHLDREEIEEAFRTGTGQSTRYSETLLKKTHYYAIRLSDKEVLRVSRTLSSELGIWGKAWAPILLVLLLFLFAIALVSRKFTSGIIKPINELNLDDPLSNSTYEELSPLLARMAKQKEELKKNKKTIERKNLEIDQVVQNMEEGIAIFSPSGEATNVNKSMQRAFKITSGSFFLAISRQPEYISLMEKGFEGEKGSFILELKNKTYLFTTSPIENEKGKFSLLLLAIDVTEKEGNERIRREFTANVSHELKTPLTSIMGYSELIENNMAKSEDVAPFASKISIEAKRLLALIEDIIELSKLEEGELFDSEASISVKEVTHSVFDSLAAKAEKKKVALKLVGADFELFGNEHILFEIIFNLVDNGIIYNNQGGSVELSLQENEGKKIIRVKDDGIGIPARASSRVFERFYRVDKSRSKESGGTGLGLAIVKHSVHKMGGEIHIESEEGVGTLITITF